MADPVQVADHHADDQLLVSDARAWRSLPERIVAAAQAPGAGRHGGTAGGRA